MSSSEVAITDEQAAILAELDGINKLSNEINTSVSRMNAMLSPEGRLFEAQRAALSQWKSTWTVKQSSANA
eukprot:ANDGO_01141.mRNA.1 hypothetical protein